MLSAGPTASLSASFTVGEQKRFVEHGGVQRGRESFSGRSSSH
jgi:hypothetical protein